MIPSSSALVSLKPARQAALQAIMTVEEARQHGARLPSMPHVRTFLRLLTGCSRINSDVARRIHGLHRDPKTAFQPETGGRGTGNAYLQPRGILSAAADNGCAG